MRKTSRPPAPAAGLLAATSRAACGRAEGGAKDADQ
jgi:hypothetical protein